MDNKIVLISSSPRRRWLLETYGYDVTVVQPQSDELPHSSVPEELARENALRKFMSVRFDGVGLAADTIVVIDGRILGKPASIAEARAFLRTLSGRTHRVITGYVIGRSEEPEVTSHEVTGVKFMELSEAEIEYMLRSENLLDKAGAYAIQGSAGLFVERIEGDYSNVIGLPMPAIYRHLKKRFGILPSKWRGQRG